MSSIQPKYAGADNVLVCVKCHTETF